MTTVRARMLLAIGLLLLAAPARAQFYHVRSYTEGDGLPSSAVRGMAQDPSGRIWFATRAGVAVFDGTEWKSFAWADGLHPADRGLVVIDDRGVPWAAATTGAAISRFDGTRWTTPAEPDPPPACRPSSMIVEHAMQTPRIVLGTGCGLYAWNEGSWRRFGPDDGLPDAHVTSLARRDDGVLVATMGGLAVLRPGSERLDAAPPWSIRGPVLGLARDRDRYWLVGPDWVGRATGDRLEFRVKRPDLGLSPGRAVATRDGRGGLFFGDLTRLYLYHPAQGLRSLDESNGLISGGVEGVLLDREGNLWAATRRGVSKIVSFRFATYRPDHGLFDAEVTAILEKRSGGFVLGHRGGLTFLNGKDSRALAFPRSRRVDAERVLDLAETPGAVWIAGNALGLGRLAGDELTWSHPRRAERVHSVEVDDAGRLWLSADSEVLVAAGSGYRPVYRFPDNIGARRLIAGRDGSVFAMTGATGLYRLREESVRHWQATDPEMNNLYAVLERADGQLWAGSGAGLVEVREGELRKTRAPMPVIERPVYFIVEGGNDQTWFGTDNGVMRWDGKQLAQFTVEDGLGGRETNRAAGIIDSEGHLWIGTTGGATVYRAELDRAVPAPPSLAGLGLEASGERVRLANEVRLGAERNDLIFSFRAIYFSDERPVLLRSRLEGYEPEWSSVYTSASQRVRYTNLPPGRYRFHVQAGNREGLWSETLSSPEILIAAPVWQQAWFWVVVFLAAVALLYIVQRYVNQSRHARRLEEEVRRRVAELRDAEEELAKAQKLEALGLLAGGIGHDFNNLLMAIRGSLSMLRKDVNEADGKWIGRADAAVERARELTEQLVTFSRGGAPVRNAARIEEVIRESASFVLRGQSVLCEIALPPDLRVVEIDAGQINQVVNNLLLNAVQAMPAGGRIRITGRNLDDPPAALAPGKYIEIAVRDEGAGIPEEHRHRIFDPYFSTKQGGAGLGLATAYTIVRRHEGLLTVESSPEGGTTFRIYLPASTERVRSPSPRSEIGGFVGARILVMDDERSVREVMGAMLESLGCIVTMTATGDEALARYERALEERSGYDVVIFDLTVPGAMGGEEAIRRLLDMDPRARAIVASGYFNAPVMAGYREHGFRAVLKKPFRLEELADALRRVLESPVGS